MKFEIEASVLKVVLSTVIKAVPGRPSHQILGNFLISLDDQRLTVTGFDLSMLISQSIDVVVKSGMVWTQLCVPAKILNDLVGKLAGTLLIETGEHGDENPKLKIKAGRSRFEIAGVKPDDYPELPPIEGDSLLLDRQVLLNSLVSVQHCMAKDETKLSLCGAYLQVKEGTLEVASTDGHRLAVSIEGIEHNGDDTAEIVQGKVIHHWIGVLKSTHVEEVTIALSETSALLMVDGLRVQGRVIEGQYPSYHKLVPNSFDTTVTVDRKALVDSILRVGTFANEKNNIVVLSASEADQTITLSSRDTELGQAEEVLNAQVSGDVKAALQITYSTEALKALNGTEVQVHFNALEDKSRGVTTPIVITSLSGDSVKQLIMPIQLRDP